MPTKCKARSKKQATSSALSLATNDAQNRGGDDNFAISPILFAVADQDLAKLTQCLSDGHDLHDSACQMCSPLLLAVKLGNLEMVSVLLEYKASIHDVDASGGTVLHHAAMNGFTEIAKCLVAVGGAELDQANKAGCTPLYQAVQHSHIECATTLIGLRANLEARTRTGATPLYIASDRGNLALANILLDAGADANTTTTFQMTPLLVASFNGHKDVVGSLLSRNVDIEQRGPCGGTSLYVSAQEGRESVARLLIERGAEIDARCNTDSDLTPSLIAAMQGHDSLVRLLLEAKSDIGTTTGKGSSLVMLAARHGKTNVLKVLVEFEGPKVLNEKNASGLSVLDVAKSGRHTETTTYIKSALAAQREDDLSAWEATLPDILEELDPLSKKKPSKTKKKRKQKANAGCPNESIANDTEEPCSLPEETEEAQDENACDSAAAKEDPCSLPAETEAAQDENACDSAAAIVCHDGNVDACSDRDKSKDVRCTAIVKPMIALPPLGSPTSAPKGPPALFPSPISLPATRPVTPLSAHSLTPGGTTSPFGFRTVLPFWPSTPESWPSLPPAVSFDTLDFSLPEKTDASLQFHDLSLSPWYSNSGLGAIDNSVFMESWLSGNFVPIANCGNPELN